jgi:CHAD domain-containing protein
VSTGPSLASTTGTVGKLLTARLGELETRLRSVVPRVLSVDDEDAVHDLRVALRRTRTLLEVGRTVLGCFHADEVRRSLREVHRATGTLRDEEVLLELVMSLGVNRPDVQSWVTARRHRERRLRSAVRRRLREGGLDGGLHLLGALLAFRVKPSRDKRVTKFARRAVDERRREVELRRADPADDAESLHRLRISYKRLRYTTETFSSALPSDVAALATTAARFQNRIGDLLDVDLAIECVQRAPALVDAGRNALLAALQRVRADRAVEYEKAMREATLAPAPVFQAAGTEALRKSSIR